MTTEMFQDELQRRLERLSRARERDLPRAKQVAQKLLERFLGAEFWVWHAGLDGPQPPGRGEAHVATADRQSWEQVWGILHPEEKEEGQP